MNRIKETSDKDQEECGAFKVANYIPLENFYIDDLAQNYNLKSDYVRWAHAQVRKT